MSVLTLYLGYRLDLFRKIQARGSVTPSELAKDAGCSERYVREWLEGLSANGYLEYDPRTRRFGLSPEHAAVLTDHDSRTFSIPWVCFIPSFSSVLPLLLKAFRTGDGVSYDQYGVDLLEAIGGGNRPMYLSDYVSRWIPAMPDVHRKLLQGGRVAEVGCGGGWSSIALARGFSQVHIDAVDVDPASIAEARRNAAQAGLSDRISFTCAPIEKAPLNGPYDLITAFECIHDLPRPVEALRRMREMAGTDGAVLVSDEAVGETLEENRTLVGRLNYNFSVLHCLPQAMGFTGSAATGAIMPSSTMRKFASEAGFRGIEILEIENPVWRFYRLNP
ncbi:MAG: class I SAM-dependent methyltransferase [Thermoplasmata archaeon]|nr:class I SAM-dependent methyltransferase [Thermoplasmata archaeon]